MSTVGICFDDSTRRPARAWRFRRPGGHPTAVGVGIVVLAVLALVKPSPSNDAQDAPMATSTSGVFPALRAASQTGRDADPKIGFLRRGLVPNAQALARWIPNTMAFPDICGQAPDAPAWSTRAFARPFSSSGTTQPRVLGPFRTVGFTQYAHPHSARRTHSGSAETLAHLDRLLPLDFAAIAEETSLADRPAGATVHGIGNPVEDIENRRTTPLGVAAESLRFDDRPGRLSAAAQAGLWNGAPATAMGVGYTLPDGRIRFDATGVTYVNSLANVGRTFEVSTVASIPLE